MLTEKEANSIAYAVVEAMLKVLRVLELTEVPAWALEKQTGQVLKVCLVAELAGRWLGERPGQVLARILQVREQRTAKLVIIRKNYQESSLLQYGKDLPGGVGSSSTGMGFPALCSLIASWYCLTIRPILRTLLVFPSFLAFSSCSLNFDSLCSSASMTVAGGGGPSAEEDDGSSDWKCWTVVDGELGVS